MPWDQGPGLRCPGALVPGFPSKQGFDHHRFGGRCLFFFGFWGCTRPVSVTVNHGRDRSREGVPPPGDLGTRVLVLDTQGFDHHRFGGRYLLFFRFWGCTQLFLEKRKKRSGRTWEASVDFGALVLFFSHKVRLCHLIPPSLMCSGP